ncbi:MAG: thiolase family protein, partial [Flavobacteriales bacterium]|nr:thiolase family protein [Flavobacteriales bacterium]
AETIQFMMNELPDFDKKRIDDVMVGNAMPEAEQGLNVGRLISLMGLNTDKVPGVTVNRYCASGSEAIAIASAKIQAGMADCIIAGGTESMSYIPMGGYKPVPESDTAKSNPDYYWGMGYTAEEVAKQYNISREEQDEFAFNSHMKALKALEEGKFANQIVPIPVEYNFLDENQKMQTKKFDFSVDEGPRKETSLEGLAKLRPVFANGGSVTAGNSSQMSDGAAFVIVMSEDMVKELGLEPEARLVAYAAAGLEPRIMGMGPIYAIPKALKQAGLELKDIDLIELNEAFASQSVAIKKELNLNPEILNVNGGAIALGHPLGCTGTKLTVQLLDEMRKRGNKYGMVSMCVGTGQGAASIFELL